MEEPNKTRKPRTLTCPGPEQNCERVLEQRCAASAKLEVELELNERLRQGYASVSGPKKREVRGIELVKLDLISCYIYALIILLLLFVLYLVIQVTVESFTVEGGAAGRDGTALKHR